MKNQPLNLLQNQRYTPGLKHDRLNGCFKYCASVYFCVCVLDIPLSHRRAHRSLTYLTVSGVAMQTTSEVTRGIWLAVNNARLESGGGSVA